MMKLDVVCVLWNVGKGRCYVGVSKSVHGTSLSIYDAFGFLA